ncbi:MAG: phosphonate C-P lyase system protein PhnH [Rhodospirillaceae bacterium]|nr:phosphonate C-P lyase system protein PhnH [Rhodospirillaceae bacterium]
MSACTSTAILADFADPAAATQGIFRAALAAMAEPGTIHEVSPDVPGIGPLAPATVALCRTLVDGDTPLWLDEAAATNEVVAYLSFHCGLRRAAEPAAAAFAVASDAAHCPALSAFAAGTPEYPDRSTTLVLQVTEIESPGDLRLSGPGIDGTRAIAVRPLPPRLRAELMANHARFPLGVDIFLAAGRRIAALPRSTRLED